QPVYIGKQQAHFMLYWKKSKPLAPTAKLSYYLKLPDTLQSIPDQPLVTRMPLANWPTEKIIADHLFIDRPKNPEAKICSIIASLSLSNPSRQHYLFDFNFH
ncbi:MAG: hypothetical protein ONB13_11780, partial [candidate division KSB1 bacterium]|nr:hypothetical protein [candidate division KSB1 bacterium]